MNDYEDGPDFDDQAFTPPDPAEKPVIDLKISNYDLGRMIDHALAQSIDRHVKAAVDKWVEKKVSKAVDALVKTISTETIKSAVEKTLTDGWGKVTEWGEQRGEKVTLSTVVREGLLKLSERPPRGYDNKPPLSPIEQIVVNMAEEGVKKGLQPVLDEAKKAFQSQLEVSMGKSLRLTLADALKG